ncbi:hypothetical protein [Paenibacillus sp. GYB003]|uniref:hypothetical protein n=1 Tax=Paenibacillus sp. GYB003 TaxID=2994392 RepID=UPI002F966FBD
MRNYGLEPIWPEGGAREDFDGFVEELKALAAPTDRDGELLIADGERERDAVAALLRKRRIEFEEFELLRLPEGAEATPLFVDYGFVSDAGAAYVYGHLCAVFRFAGGEADAEPAQAELQMEEHLIAKFKDGGHLLFVADRAQTDLHRGIAKAYRCRLEFVYGGDTP